MKAKLEISNKKLPKFKFMAMSKLIGIIAFSFVFIITVYSLKEMHDTGIYDALPQLIISAFGFASVYTGFYITMAKMEHIEEERTKREKELTLLKKNKAPEEDIENKKQEIESLKQNMNDIMNETTQTLL